MKKEKKTNNKRGIGNILLEGPFMLAPHSSENTKIIALMEVVTMQCRNTSANKPAFGFGIYSDQTVNRHKNFEKPVVRFIIWDRSKDMTTNHKWPSVKIYHHTLNSEEVGQLDIFCEKLDEALNNIKLFSSKADVRDSVPIETEKWQRFLPIRIRRWNGAQKLEYSMSYYPEEETEYEKVVFDMTEYIRKLCMEKPEKVNFEEVYSFDLTKIVEGSHTWTLSNEIYENEINPPE